MFYMQRKKLCIMPVKQFLLFIVKIDKAEFLKIEWL